MEAQVRSNRTLLGIALLALAVSIAALALATWAAIMKSTDNLGTSDGVAALYTYPRDLEGVIIDAEASIATIYCKDGQGTGWVLGSKTRGKPASTGRTVSATEFPGNVITNHHVIEECIDSPDSIRVIAGGKRQLAKLFNWDKRTDLALIAIAEQLPDLKLSGKPQPGWWAMTYGTPFGAPGSVAIGNIINIDGSLVSTTSAVNPGNSGGPLFNALGEVMATVTGSGNGPGSQDWNFAAGLPMLCRVILSCEVDEFGWSAIASFDQGGF